MNPRKRRTNPRISELDLHAAHRRRAQMSAAQRAYRQRNDDMIESLTAQVTKLQGVIKSLNSCFLALADQSMTSQWVQHDPQSSREVKKFVDSFLSIRKVYETMNHEEPGSQTQGQGHSMELTTSRAGSEENRASFWLRNGLKTVKDKLAKDVGPQTHPLGDAFAAEILPYHEQSTHNNCNSEVTCTTSEQRLYKPARHPMLYLPRTVPHPFEIPGIFPRTFPDIDNGSFAQRLHLSCVRAAYKLSCEARRRPQEFQRVFNVHRLFHTRENLEDMLGKILWGNLDHLLEAPPEPNSEVSQDVTNHPQLLNVSEVAAFYHNKGYVIDGYSDNLIREKANDEIQGDVWLDLDNINDFRISTTAMIEEQSRDERTSLVNIAKLIDELIVGAQCLGTRPGFRKDRLDYAIIKAAS